MQVSEGEAAGLVGVQSALGQYEVDADKAGRQVIKSPSYKNAVLFRLYLPVIAFRACTCLAIIRCI